MRSDIQQVLEMNKTGKITGEQAAALLEELLGASNRSNSDAQSESSAQSTFTTQTAPPLSAGAGEERKSPHHGRDHSRSCHGAVADSVNSLVNSVFDHVFEAQDRFGSTFEADRDSNRFHHSDYSAPRGDSFVFRGNQVRMSKLRDLHLERAEFTNSQIDASRLQEVNLTDSKISDARLRASSLRELTLDHGEISTLQLSTSKCSEITLSDESAWRSLHAQSSVLKEIRLRDHSRWENSFLNAVVISGFNATRSALIDCELQNSRLLETTFTDSEWKAVLARGTTLSELALTGSAFDRVLFTCDESWGWKKKSFCKLRFENSRLTNVLFTDCRMSHCAIRNVTLSDLKISGLDLSNRTLDGNEAFLTAVGAHRQ